MERLVCLAIGYVFGIFQTAYIYGKMHGIDIRQCGSGNAGATNTLRVLGKKAGLIVFLGDVAKTVLAVLAVRLIFGSKYPDMLPLLGMYAAAGIHPVWSRQSLEKICACWQFHRYIPEAQLNR